MAETYPGRGPEISSGESGKDKKSSGKSSGRIETPNFVLPKPPSIEKLAVDSPVKIGEPIRPFGEAAKPPIETSPKVTEHAREAEQSSDWRQVSAEELHARSAAAAAAAEQLLHHETMKREQEYQYKDEKDKKTGPDMPDKEQGNETDSVTGPKPAVGVESPAPKPGPETEHVPEHDAESEAAFDRIVHAPELVDFAAKELPEAPDNPAEELVQPEDFDTWVRREHPELHDAEMAGDSTPDNESDDVVRHSPGENASEPARFHEQAPGEPPADHGRGESPPNSPPTAEGGDWGDGDEQPEPNVAENYAPNPDALHDPWIPAGGLTDPSTVARLNAIESRQELDSLQHSARESGLAGAVGVLGLGLILDHLWARRRFRRQKRQMNEQNKALKKTGERLQQEQYAHQATRAKVERLSSAQHATNEQLRRVQQNRPPSGAEAPKGSGLISEAAAAELASKAGRQHEHARPMTDKELEWKLKHSRELGRAIKRNPELRDSAEWIGVAAAATAEAHHASETKVFNNEGTHERLQSQYLDAANQGGANKIGAGSIDMSAMSAHSQMQQAGGLPGLPSSVQPSNSQQAKARSKIAKPWALATVVFLMAIGLIYLLSR